MLFNMNGKKKNNKPGKMLNNIYGRWQINILTMQNKFSNKKRTAQ